MSAMITGIVIAAVGTASTIYNQNKAAHAAQAAGDLNAQAEWTNEQEAVIRAETNLTEQTQANRQAEGQQRASIAGSGVSVATGSPLDAEVEQRQSDLFKDQVAIFNGIVNASYDQAQGIIAQEQGQQVASAATASEASSIASLGMMFAQTFGKGG